MKYLRLEEIISSISEVKIGLQAKCFPISRLLPILLASYSTESFATNINLSGGSQSISGQVISGDVYDTTNSGTLNVEAGNSTVNTIGSTTNGAIGSLNIESGGTLTVTGNSLKTVSGITIGDGTTTGNTLVLQGTALTTGSSINGTATNSGALQINGSGASVTLGAAIGGIRALGAVSLTQGSLTTAGYNINSGSSFGTTVAGTLNITSGSSIHSTLSPLALSGSGVINFNDALAVITPYSGTSITASGTGNDAVNINASVTTGVSGPIAGVGASGIGNAIGNVAIGNNAAFTVSGTNVYSQAITVGADGTGASLSVSSSGAIYAPIAVGASNTGGRATFYLNSGSSSGAVTVNSGAGSSKNRIVVTGGSLTGGVTLNGISTFSQSAGSVDSLATSAGSSGSNSLSGGTLGSGSGSAVTLRGTSSFTSSGTGSISGDISAAPGTVVTIGSSSAQAVTGTVTTTGSAIYHQSTGTVGALVTSSGTAVSNLSGGTLGSFSGEGSSTFNILSSSTLNSFALASSSVINAAAGSVGGGTISGSNAAFIVTSTSNASLTGDILGGGNAGNVLVQNNWAPAGRLGTTGSSLKSIAISDNKTLTISHDIAATNVYLGSGGTGASLTTNANNLTVTGKIDGTSGFSSSHIGTLNVANSGFVVSGNIGSSTPLAAINITNSGSLDVSGSNASINATQTRLGSGSTLTLGSGQLTGLVDGSASGSGTLQFAATQSTNGAIGSSYTLNTVGVTDSKTLTSAGVINAQNLILGAGAELLLQSRGNLGGSPAVSMGSGAILDLSAVTNQTLGNISGSGTILLGSHTLTATGSSTSTFSGSIQGSTASLRMSGSGTQILSGSNTYTGSTTISSGTLALAGSGAISSSSSLVDNGTFDISATTSGASINNFSGSGTVTLGSQTLSVIENSNATFSGSIQGTGALTKLGTATLNLSGNNSYTGTTTISSGTLALVGSGAISSSSDLVNNAIFNISATTSGASVNNLSGSGTVTLGSRTLNVTENSNGTFSGLIQGTGALIKAGSGTLRLSATNTYTGGTTVTGGELAILTGGSLVSAVSVSDGSGNKLTVSGGSVTGGVTLNGVSTFTQSAGYVDSLNSALGSSGANTLSGGTLGSGTGTVVRLYGSSALTASAASSIAGDVSVSGTTALTINSSSASAVTGTVTAVGSATYNQSAGTVQSFNTSTGTTSTLSGGTLVSFGGYNSSVLDVTGGHLNYFNLGCHSTLNAIGGSIDGGVISSPNANFVIPSGSTMSLGGDILGDGAGDSGNVIVETSWEPAARLGTVLAPLNQIQVSDGNTLTISHDIAATNIYLGSGAGGSSLDTDADNLVVTGNIDGTSGFSSSHIGTLNVANLGFVVSGNIGSSTPLDALNVINAGDFDVSATNTSINVNQTTLGFRSTLTLGSGQLTGLIDGNDIGFGTLIFAGNNSTNGDIGSNYSLNTVGIAASKVLTSSNSINALILNIQTGAELHLQSGASLNGTPAVIMANSSLLDLSDAGSQTIGILLGSGNISLGSHALTTNLSGTHTFSGSIQDGGIGGGSGGSFTVSGDGTQILSGENSYTGTTTINSGTLKLLGNGSITSASALVNNGVFDISQTTFGAVIQNLSGSGIILLGSLPLTVDQNVDQTFSGSIQGLGSLTKSGTGILTLNGTNTYQGGTTVTDGAIEIGPEGSIIGGIIHAGSSVFNQSQGNVDSLVSSSTAISTLSGGVLGSFVGLDTATLNMSGDSTLNFFGLVGSATLNASGGVLGGGSVSGNNASFVVAPNSTVSLTGDILGGGNSGNVLVQTNWTSGAKLGVVGETLKKIQVFDGNTLTIGHDIAATNVYLGSGANGSSLSTGANNLLVTGYIDGTMGLGSSHLGTLNVANSGFVVSGNIGSSTPLAAINITNRGTLDVSGSNASISANQITIDLRSKLTLGSGQLTGLVDGASSGVGTLKFAQTNSTNGAIGSNYPLNTIDIAASKTLTSAYLISAQNLTLEAGSQLLLQSGGGLGETAVVSMSDGSNLDISGASSQTIDTLSGSGNILLGSHTLTTNASTTTLFSGIIQDGGLGGGSGASFTMSGTGNQILSGANSYTGTTTISSGTLSLSDAGSINSSSALINNGVFDVSQATSSASIQTLSGSGSIVLGSNPLSITQNSNQTFSGSIDGLGSLTKLGNSTLTLTGSNSYQGATTLAGGTVAVVANSCLGNSSASLTFNGGSLDWQQTDSSQRSTVIESGGGSINVDNGVNLNFSGPITGSGTLVKMGSGQLQLLTGDSSAFTGLTSIEDGELKLNAVLGGNITINGSNAFLSGTGTILGNLVVSQGRLAPGNSIGTINVGGNLTQESTSTYYVQLNELGQSTRTNVTGSATINDATLDVTSLTGVYNVHQPYTIITAQEGITGQYGNIIVHQLALIPSAQISDDNLNMLLSFQRSFINAAATSNQESVAQQLETIVNPTQPQSDLLDEITAISGSPIQYTFDQLSGEQYTNLLIGVEQTTRQVVRTQYNHIRDLAAAPIGCQLDQDDRDMSFWVEGDSSKATYANNDSNSGFKSHGVAASVGFQRELNFDSTLGASVTHENLNLKDNLEATSKQSSTFLGLYGLYRPNGYYALANVVTGYTKSSVDRAISINDTSYMEKGSTTSWETMFYAEIGKDYSLGAVFVQPFVGLEAGIYTHDFETENNNGPIDLHIRQKTYAALSSRMGLHMSVVKIAQSTNLGLDLAWQHRFSSISNNLNAKFKQFGNSYKVEGIGYEKDTLEAVFTLSQKITKSWEAFIQASGQWGQNSKNYGGAVGVNIHL